LSPWERQKSTLIELPAASYFQLRGLVQKLAEFNVILDAVIRQTTPAWVVVDQAEQPDAALLVTAEGAFLVGDAEHSGFVDDLRDFFARAETVPGYWQGGSVLSLFVDTAWEPRLPDIFPRRQPVPYARQHYLCTTRRRPDWRAGVPPGFAVERIEPLKQPHRNLPEHLTSWMESNWGSVEDFVAHGGFAFGTLHHNELVSWSVADAVAGSRCEIGIRTHPHYRRRGLATLTTLAAVDYALASGLVEVGWHCNADNRGSIGTALKAGFEKERDYVAYWYPIHEQV
jgi:RimJ/RimL family protein N-acetyltransferase